MHSSVCRFLSIASLAFLLTSAAPSAAADAITGRVVDQDGRAVPGARVIVAGNGVALVTATAGAEGDFSVEAPDGVRLTVRVAREGFRADPIWIEPGGPRDVGTIQLAVSALTETVVVSAAQVEVPSSEVASSLTVLTGADLQARQLASVADALRLVPGLTVAATGGVGTTTGVFPRGGESNYTLVLIDGVPANAFGGDYDFAQLSTANVDRVEIVRGPQSALYGANAIGGVVRIVTRQGGAPEGAFSVETGQFGASRIVGSTAGQRGELEWGALIERLGSDGMNGEQVATGETVENDDYDRTTGGIALGWRRDSAWVRGNFRYSHDERGFPGPFGSNPIGAYTGIDLVSRGTNDRTVGSAALSLPVASRVRLQAQGGLSRLESDFASSFGGSESGSRRGAVRGQADVTMGGGVDLSAGVEVLRERATSTFITGEQSQQIPIKRTIAGYFAEARWQTKDRLFVTGGLRIEDIRRSAIEADPASFSPRPAMPEDTIVSTNPRVSAAWLLSNDGASYTRVRGAVGSGIRPPDSFELAFTDNPGLRPERSVSAEAGLDRALASGHVLIETTGFFNDYDDLIIAVGSFSGASRYRTDNISNARSRGLELAATLRGRVAGPTDLTAKIGYTFLDTEVLAVDSGQAAPPPFEVGQPLLRRPRHQFFADVAAAAGRLSAFARGGARSRALDVEPSFGTFGGLFDAPGYQVWDIGGAVRVARPLDVFVRVENLFDRTYEEAFGFPALGRRATVGLRIAASR